MGRAVLPSQWFKSRSRTIALTGIVNNCNANFLELYTEKTVVFPLTLHASKTFHNIYTAPTACTITGITYVPDVAQGAALTAVVSKVVGTNAPAAGTTPMHTGTINLNGAANTVQVMTLTGVAADLVLAAGQRIGISLSGALTTAQV